MLYLRNENSLRITYSGENIILLYLGNHSGGVCEIFFTSKLGIYSLKRGKLSLNLNI